MRDELDKLLEDVTLLTIAFAIALGWSLFQVARGVAAFIDGLVIHLPGGQDGGIPYFGQGTGLTWVVRHHLVTLDGILTGIVELAIVLAVAAFVRTRAERQASEPSAD
jgi:hypothetical protein